MATAWYSLWLITYLAKRAAVVFTTHVLPAVTAKHTGKACFHAKALVYKTRFFSGLGLLWNLASIRSRSAYGDHNPAGGPWYHHWFHTCSPCPGTSRMSALPWASRAAHLFEQVCKAHLCGFLVRWVRQVRLTRCLSLSLQVILGEAATEQEKAAVTDCVVHTTPRDPNPTLSMTYSKTAGASAQRPNLET
jgi:hypothetical protein